MTISTPTPLLNEVITPRHRGEEIEAIILVHLIGYPKWTQLHHVGPFVEIIIRGHRRDGWEKSHPF